MYFITVFEKVEMNHDLKIPLTGATRTWGYFSERKDAVDALHKNALDMHETFYDYAVMEKFGEGITPMAEECQFLNGAVIWEAFLRLSGHQS